MTPLAIFDRDGFAEPSFISMLFGLGVAPQAWDPFIDRIDEQALRDQAHLKAGQRVLIMDADLQDPPELLPDMLAVMDQGADVVYAQRRSRPPSVHRPPGAQTTRSGRCR